MPAQKQAEDRRWSAAKENVLLTECDGLWKSRQDEGSLFAFFDRYSDGFWPIALQFGIQIVQWVPLKPFPSNNRWGHKRNKSLIVAQPADTSSSPNCESVNPDKHHAMVLGTSDYNFSFPVEDSLDLLGMTIDNQYQWVPLKSFKNEQEAEEDDKHLRCTYSAEDNDEAEADDDNEKEETYKTPLMIGEEARPLLCANGEERAVQDAEEEEEEEEEARPQGLQLAMEVSPAGPMSTS